MDMVESKEEEELLVYGVDDILAILKSDYENAYFVTGEFLLFLWYCNSWKIVIIVMNIDSGKLSWECWIICETRIVANFVVSFNTLANLWYTEDFIVIMYGVILLLKVLLCGLLMGLS